MPSRTDDPRKQQDCYARCVAENYDPNDQQRVQLRCYTKCIARPQMGDDLYGDLDSLLGGLLPGGVPFRNPFAQLGSGSGSGCGCGSRGSAAGRAVLGGDVQILASPQVVQRQVAPCGYVIVCKANGQKVAMLREVAYALGLKKRPTKRGGISGKDIQTAKRVQGVIMSLSVRRAPKVPIKGARRRAS